MGKKMYNEREKYCPGCKAWLPLDRFHNCKSEPSGKRTRCKICFKRQNDPHVRKYLYGLTDEQLMALWEKQERRCGVCREPIPFRGGQASHIDHDRITGEVRGILCPRCNRGLRAFQDNQVLLAEAAKYLQKFEKERKERRKRGIEPVCLSHALPPRRTEGASGRSVSSASSPKTTPSLNGS
jgi:hypothetical protein